MYLGRPAVACRPPSDLRGHHYTEIQTSVVVCLQPVISPRAPSSQGTGEYELRYADWKPPEGWLASNAEQRSRKKRFNSLIVGISY